MAAYTPPEFTSKRVISNYESRGPVVWADPKRPFDLVTPRTVSLQDAPRPPPAAMANRPTYESVPKPIKFDEHGLPRNPRGRTGMRGRGLLGRWGPNLAADPIVTRLHPLDNTLQVGWG